MKAPIKSAKITSALKLVHGKSLRFALLVADVDVAAELPEDMCTVLITSDTTLDLLPDATVSERVDVAPELEPIDEDVERNPP
jgi:hypothetical protein